MGVLALLLAGSFADGDYLRDVLVNVGSALLLVVPLVAAERSIIEALESGAKDSRAAQTAEATAAIGELFSDLGERLAKPRPLPTATVEEIQAMLARSGWERRGLVRGFQVWGKGDQAVAVPSGEPLDYTVQRHITKVTGWTDEGFFDLFLAVGGQPSADWSPPRLS